MNFPTSFISIGDAPGWEAHIQPAQTAGEGGSAFRSLMLSLADTIEPAAADSQSSPFTRLFLMQARDTVEEEEWGTGGGAMTAPPERCMSFTVQPAGQHDGDQRAHQSLPGGSTAGGEAPSLGPSSVDVAEPGSRPEPFAWSDGVAPVPVSTEGADGPQTPRKVRNGPDSDPSDIDMAALEKPHAFPAPGTTRPEVATERLAPKQGAPTPGGEALPARSTNAAAKCPAPAYSRSNPLSDALAQPRGRSPATQDSRPEPFTLQQAVWEPRTGAPLPVDGRASGGFPLAQASTQPAPEALPFRSSDRPRDVPTLVSTGNFGQTAPLDASRPMSDPGPDQPQSPSFAEPDSRSAPDARRHRFSPEDRTSGNGIPSVHEQSRVSPVQGQDRRVPSPAASGEHPVAADLAEQELAPAGSTETKEPTRRDHAQTAEVTRSVAADPSPIVKGEPSPSQVQPPLAPDGENSFAEVRHEPASTTPKDPVPIQPARSHAVAEPGRLAVEQVIAAVKTSGEGAFDIQLSPEELGRVRLSMTPLETEMIVTISAERGETLDLMRRHIDLLARDFREQGYASVQFSFEQGENNGAHAKPRLTRQAEPPEEVHGASETPPSRSIPPAGIRAAGLDLRL